MYEYVQFLPFCWHCSTVTIVHFVPLVREPTTICRRIPVQLIRRVQRAISKTGPRAREVFHANFPDWEMKSEEDRWAAGAWRLLGPDHWMILRRRTRCDNYRVAHPSSELPMTQSSRYLLCWTDDDAAFPMPLCGDILALPPKLHITHKTTNNALRRVYFLMTMRVLSTRTRK